MLKQNHRSLSMGRQLLLVIITTLILIISIYASMPLGQQPAQIKDYGMLVTGLEYDSLAQTVGLQRGDIIKKYNDKLVIDKADYRRAVKFYQAQPEPNTATLTINRNGNLIVLNVPKGKLGFQSEDVNPLYDEINTAIDKKEFAKAQRLITQGSRNNTLSVCQVLIAKISLIPDGATPQQVATGIKLYDQLMELYPKEDLGYLGWHEFLLRGHNNVAIITLQEYLKDHPGDVSNLLNIALAWQRLGEYDEATKIVDEVLARRPDAGLSPYGYAVAYRIKGRIALTKGDYPQALKYFHDTLENNSDPKDHSTYKAYLFVAAQLNDLAQFYQLRDYCQKNEAETLTQDAYFFDCLEAYLLVTNKHPEQAIELAKKWQDNPMVAKQLEELNNYTGGKAVLDTWHSLFPKTSSPSGKVTSTLRKRSTLSKVH